MTRTRRAAAARRGSSPSRPIPDTPSACGIGAAGTPAGQPRACSPSPSGSPGPRRRCSARRGRPTRIGSRRLESNTSSCGQRRRTMSYRHPRDRGRRARTPRQPPPPRVDARRLRVTPRAPGEPTRPPWSTPGASASTEARLACAPGSLAPRRSTFQPRAPGRCRRRRRLMPCAARSSPGAAAGGS